MADTAVQRVESAGISGQRGFLRKTFLHNLPAKIAALPMVATVLVVFVGCTLWTIYYSFTNS